MGAGRGANANPRPGPSYGEKVEAEETLREWETQIAKTRVQAVAGETENVGWGEQGPRVDMRERWQRGGAGKVGGARCRRGLSTLVQDTDAGLLIHAFR